MQSSSMDDMLERVSSRVAPLWPLADYVAVNPFVGVVAQPFLAARQELRSYSDCEMLMPLEYYADQFRRGRFDITDLEQVHEEGRSPSGDLAGHWSAEEIIAQLEAVAADSLPADGGISASNAQRRIYAVSEWLDRTTGSDWTSIIVEEIAKIAAAHYDQGQAFWTSPWRHLPLYEAWQNASRHDRQVELLGLTAFRQHVARLPRSPSTTIADALHALGVPPRLWESFLLCQLFTMPGWSAWVKYRDDTARRSGQESSDLAGLLAIRLTYEVALAKTYAPQICWEPEAGDVAGEGSDPCESTDHAALRHALLRASEVRFRSHLLNALSANSCGDHARKAVEPTGVKASRKLAQMVFCIDVRSERLRRHLEAVCGRIQTCGFAGFFGLPLEYVQLGAKQGTSQVPVLLSPQFQLTEGLRGVDLKVSVGAVARRTALRQLRQAWKTLQTSAVSCFSFVESSGLFYGLRLLSRTCGLARASEDGRFDGVARRDRSRLGPTLQGLHQQGITTSRQADLAESILRGTGLTDNFARLVVFCGHGSQTENNPLQAGLDCGACGGHAGEPNARFAALLLNQESIRQSLAERGIVIPEDVHFLAALHNTTTDRIEFFDLDEVPASHQADVVQLSKDTQVACERTRMERLPVLSSQSVSRLIGRSRDWSEVRPEWGLAGNAAFIAAPRALTKSVDLEGRSFLHDYDHNGDPDGTILEQIMTAPLVVAHLINMQYYASTVDNIRLGSGTKTIHNVVGGFGIHAGNGGDLMTGLPWQSLHTGTQLQHQPVRLLAVIAAPRAMIEGVINRHEQLASLLANEWIQLVAVEDDSFHRFTCEKSWQQLEPAAALEACG